MPQELADALKNNSKAQTAFEALNKTNRFAFIWRVQTAKRPETRANRVEKLVEMLERGEKLY